MDEQNNKLTKGHVVGIVLWTLVECFAFLCVSFILFYFGYALLSTQFSDIGWLLICGGVALILAFLVTLLRNFEKEVEEENE